MTENKYPAELKELVEIYRNSFWETITLAEKAYDLGRKQAADPLDGYSNLTAAIKEGTDIDWGELGDVPVKCVHPKFGTLAHHLERYEDTDGFVFDAERPDSWDDSGNEVWGSALNSAWFGNEGWTLYIKGEVPVKRKTADQLEPGTYFKGKHDACLDPYIVAMKGNGNAVHITHDMRQSNTPAPLWEVLEVLGTFGGDQ